jgi:fructokinase
MRPHVPQIGVDFGGTEIEAAALSRDGRIAVACRAPTPTNYEAALTTVCDLVGRVEAELDGWARSASAVPVRSRPAQD